MVVVHSGARHSYALPAIFARAGMLAAFHTDVCAGRGIGKLAALEPFLPMPVTTRALLSRLADRRPPPEVLARTTTDDWATVAYERKVRRLADPADRRRAQREQLSSRAARLGASQQSARLPRAPWRKRNMKDEAVL